MKRETIKFRCSIYEKKVLKKRAQKAGVSLSEYCRSSAFGNNLVERLTSEQLEYYSMLVNHKNNFTRIGNMFKKHNPKLAEEVRQLQRKSENIFTISGNDRQGKSISHTRASISYGWNQEKNAEIIHSQHLAGENPKEFTEEFKIIQEQNQRCEKNTLSFVLSPAVEGGQKLSNKQLKELTQKFIEKMELKERQAIAFVHRDKEHTHIHLYVNRIGFDGKAYKDNFIGKRSQMAAQEVAKEMGLTTVKEVQWEKQYELRQLRGEIKRFHEKVMAKTKPKDFDQYIKYMKRYDVKVIPSINKSNKLQGFRFEFKGHNLKGSEVHRSMSINNLALQLSKNNEKGILIKGSNTVWLLDKKVELSANIALRLSKTIVKRIIKKGLETGIGI